MIWQIFLVSIGVLIKETQTATNVSGVLVQNTAWTLTGSPYNVVNDVHIPRNVTLTIQKGVYVNFGQGDFEILVKGFLQMQGTSAKKVIFEGGLITNQKSMIKFQSTQLSLSSINYTVFSGPKKALLIATAVNGLPQNSDTLSVLSSSFLDNTMIQVEGVYSALSTPLEIESSSFSYTAIYNKNLAPNKPIRIINSNIYYSRFLSDCRGECIYVSNCTLKHSAIDYNSGDYANGFILSNSKATNITAVSSDSRWNNQYIVLVIKTSIINDFIIASSYGFNDPTSHISFEDSTISNVSTAIDDMLYTSLGLRCSLIIRRCKVTQGNLVFDNSHDTPRVSIISSTLKKVSFSPSATYNPQYNVYASIYMRNTSFVEGSLNLPYYYTDIAYSDITLTSSLIVGGSSIISCSSIGRHNSVPQASTVGIIALGLTMTNSTIKNFDTAIRASPPLRNTVTISNTNFRGNSLYNIENKGAFNITATGNYWGTNNNGVIVNKIFDYWDNINYGDVLYTGYASSLLPAEAGCPAYIEEEEVGQTTMGL